MCYVEALEMRENLGLSNISCLHSTIRVLQHKCFRPYALTLFDCCVAVMRFHRKASVTLGASLQQPKVDDHTEELQSLTARVTVDIREEASS